MHNPPTEGPTLRSYLEVLWRRKITVVVVVVVACSLAFLVSHEQTKQFQGSAQLILQTQRLPTVIAPPDPSANQNPDRNNATQAALAEDPAVARRALEIAGVRSMSPAQLVRATNIVPSSLSNLLSFEVTLRDAQLAQRLASSYAEAFSLAQKNSQLAALSVAQRGLERQVKALQREVVREKSTGSESPATAQAYKTMVENYQQVVTFRSVLTSGQGNPVQRATSAVQVAPKTSRNIIVGVVLGLVFGVLLAFAREAVDSRLRTAVSIETVLSYPLLSRIATPPRKVVKSGRLVMQTDPDTEYGEAYRVLVANLDLSNVVRQAKTIMITSATVGEGKTTATGNLGLALARGGRDVAIIDFDFHRPNLGAFFGLGTVLGVSDVLVGRAALSQASYTVHLDDRDEESESLLGTPNQGKLTVIPAGQSTRPAVDRLSAPVVGNLVAELRERFDMVIFDTPPLLVVSEGLTLSKQVDGMVIVTSAEKIAEPQLREMRQRLALVTCTPLGFIITGAEEEEGYSYRSYEPYWSNGDRPKSHDSRHAAKTRDAHA